MDVAFPYLMKQKCVQGEEQEALVSFSHTGTQRAVCAEAAALGSCLLRSSYPPSTELKVSAHSEG